MKLRPSNKNRYKDISLKASYKQYSFTNSKENYIDKNNRSKTLTQNPTKNLPAIFWVIMFTTMSLTLATAQYYYQLTSKVSKQREAIFNLYDKLQIIKKEKNSSEMVLNEISNNDKVEKGFYYFLDQEQSISKQASEMLASYNTLQKNKGSLESQLSVSLIILLIEVIFIFYFIIKWIRLKQDCKEIEDFALSMTHQP